MTDEFYRCRECNDEEAIGLFDVEIKRARHSQFLKILDLFKNLDKVGEAVSYKIQSNGLYDMVISCITDEQYDKIKEILETDMTLFPKLETIDEHIRCRGCEALDSQYMYAHTGE